MLAIGRAGALKLLQQVGEGLLIDNGKKHFADDSIGVSECYLGQPTQKGVFTGHPFHSAEQLAFDPPLGARTDAVDDLDQQLGKRLNIIIKPRLFQSIALVVAIYRIPELLH